MVCMSMGLATLTGHFFFVTSFGGLPTLCLLQQLVSRGSGRWVGLKKGKKLYYLSLSIYKENGLFVLFVFVCHN